MQKLTQKKQQGNGRRTSDVMPEAAAFENLRSLTAAPTPVAEYKSELMEREVITQALPGGGTLRCTTVVTPQLIFQREQQRTIQETLEQGGDARDTALLALRTLQRRPDLVEWFVRVPYGLRYNPATPEQQEAALRRARHALAAKEAKGSLKGLTIAEKKALNRFGIGDVICAIGAFFQPGPDDRPIVPVALRDNSVVEKLMSRSFESLSEVETQMVRRRIVEGVYRHSSEPSGMPRAAILRTLPGQILG